MRIITTRIENKLDFYESCEQSSLRNRFRTYEHLQRIRTIIEKPIEYKRQLVLVFVDFHKAVDTVEQDAVLESTKILTDYRTSS